MRGFPFILTILNYMVSREIVSHLHCMLQALKNLQPALNMTGLVVFSAELENVLLV